MVIRRDRERDEDCGAPDSRQFGDGRRACAPDKDVRVGKARGHILEIRAQLGWNVVAAIPLAHRIEIFGTALLRHLKALAKSRRKHGEAIWHDLREHPCALAAAGNQNLEQAVFGRDREILVAQGPYFGR